MPRSLPALLTPFLRDLDRNHLVPLPTELAVARERASGLIEALNRRDAWLFELVYVREHGSLARGTAVRAGGDIDLLTVLDPEALRTRGGGLVSPSKVIAELARHVEAHRAGLVSMGHLEIRRQDHSVGCWYPSSGVQVDLVPAVADVRAFWIPERGSRSWIRTSPSAAKARLTRAEGLCPEVRAAVRLLKGWSRARGSKVPLSSYALETVVVRRALAGEQSLGELVLGTLHELAEAHAGRRLVLGGGAHEGTPVTVRGAGEEGNLAGELGPSHRSALIDAARWSRDRLEWAAELLGEGRSPRGPLLDVFVGTRR